MNPDLRRIIAEIFEIKEGDVATDLKPENVALWDSLNHLRLITELESELDLKFSMREIQSIESVGTLVELVERHLAQ